MAQQKGNMKLQGTIGDITFYKSNDAYLAHEKGDVVKEPILNDPAVQHTPENISEFGRSGAAGKLFRDAFRITAARAKDNRLTGRLTRSMILVLQQDTESERGRQSVDAADLSIIEGFDFNNRARLHEILYIGYTVTIDRTTRTLSVSIPDFSPVDSLIPPTGATHYNLFSADAGINFVEDTFIFSTDNSGALDLTKKEQESFFLVNNLKDVESFPLFLVLGIEFFQRVNGQYYSLHNGLFNALLRWINLSYLMLLNLIRNNSSNGTNGELFRGADSICYTIELPWIDNTISKSCTLEGRIL